MLAKEFSAKAPEIDVSKNPSISLVVPTKKEVLELEIPTGQPLWYEMENEKLTKSTIKNKNNEYSNITSSI